MLAACLLVRIADVARTARFTDATCAEGLAIRREDQRAVRPDAFNDGAAAEEAAMAREGPDPNTLGR